MNVAKKEDSENCFRTEKPQETLKWKSILGRKFKGGGVKIIIRMCVEVSPSIEKIEKRFCDRTR